MGGEFGLNQEGMFRIWSVSHWEFGGVGGDNFFLKRGVGEAVFGGVRPAYHTVITCSIDLSYSLSSSNAI